jgi:hypothetical protein
MARKTSLGERSRVLTRIVSGRGRMFHETGVRACDEEREGEASIRTDASRPSGCRAKHRWLGDGGAPSRLGCLTGSVMVVAPRSANLGMDARAITAAGGPTSPWTNTSFLAPQAPRSAAFAADFLARESGAAERSVVGPQTPARSSDRLDGRRTFLATHPNDGGDSSSCWADPMVSAFGARKRKARAVRSEAASFGDGSKGECPRISVCDPDIGVFKPAPATSPKRVAEVVRRRHSIQITVDAEVVRLQPE